MKKHMNEKEPQIERKLMTLFRLKQLFPLQCHVQFIEPLRPKRSTIHVKRTLDLNQAMSPTMMAIPMQLFRLLRFDPARLIRKKKNCQKTFFCRHLTHSRSKFTSIQSKLKILSCCAIGRREYLSLSPPVLP